MIKEFARWLFMKMYKAELISVRRYIEAGMERSEPKTSLRIDIGFKASQGALETLETLTLLVR